MKIGLFIPTFNAGTAFEEVLDDIEISINKSKLDIKKLVIDTESKDNTVALAKSKGYEVYPIKKEEFTHGEVRRRAASYLDECDFIIYITQDVRLHSDSIKEIVKFINKYPHMAVAYGKQIADPSESTIFEWKARQFNYPDKSLVKSKSDIKTFGVKTVFSSDAFSIYRREILIAVGSFPPNVLYCEDQYVAAKSILKGYQVGYCSDAVVTHSNHLSLGQQYKRYKSIGNFHKENPWIQKEFGSNESEGIKSVFSEWKYLITKGRVYLIPYSLLLNVVKYLAYKF